MELNTSENMHLGLIACKPSILRVSRALKRRVFEMPALTLQLFAGAFGAAGLIEQKLAPGKRSSYQDQPVGEMVDSEQE